MPRSRYLSNTQDDRRASYEINLMHDENARRCPVCGPFYRTAQGWRQHILRSHPDTYVEMVEEARTRAQRADR